MDEKLKQAMVNAFGDMCKNEIKVSCLLPEPNAPKAGSKFGGKPNLPVGFQWPYHAGESYDGVVKDRPLAFLAEINLREASKFDTENLLPSTGVLSFFYEMENQFWGFDPKDKGCARVFYFEDENSLFPNEFPESLHSDYHFPELLLAFEQRVSLPSYEDFYGTPQEKEISAKYPAQTDASDWDAYDALKEEYGCGLGEDTIKLLGYPDVIQNSMERECEGVTRGFYLGGGTEIPEDIEAEIEERKKDWILLFQMGTVQSHNFELMFGDCGQIYFWIKKDDLAKRNFNNSWLILQCY